MEKTQQTLLSNMIKTTKVAWKCAVSKITDYYKKVSVVSRSRGRPVKIWTHCTEEDFKRATVCIEACENNRKTLRDIAES